ncbi:hypothetical protein [Geodermatophilus maliterrae]|uniref:DUF2269 domain-containing protein n=1 Tax=Geodermatophilus maliterrae TaxID=3162531 RepID=A0ABV3XG66_9ACTN
MTTTAGAERVRRLPTHDRAATPRPAPPPWRLGARPRKALLLVHVCAAGSWLGFAVVLGLLVLAATTAEDPTVPAAALVSIATFATWPLLVLGLLTLASGVLLGTGTKYGLLRYWWVAVKLVLNVLLVTLVVLLLGPEVTRLAADARGTLDGGGSLPVFSDLVFPPTVSTTALLVAMVLSVFKPWGRIRRGRWDSGRPRESTVRVIEEA